MNRRLSAPILAIALLAPVLPGFLTGCASVTTPPFRRTEVIGVVYDEQGLPVPGATIRLAGKRCGVSDSFGRFSCRGVNAGTPSFSVRAVGFEPLDRTVSIYSRRTLIRADLVSVAALVDEAIAAAESGHARRLRSLSNRVSAIDRSDPRAVLLRELLESLAEEDR